MKQLKLFAMIAMLLLCISMLFACDSNVPEDTTIDDSTEIEDATTDDTTSNEDSTSGTEDETIPHIHTEVIDNAVAPTCTDTGLTEGKHCSVCHTVIVEQQVVSATGHSWDNDCDQNCNSCDETRTTTHKDENTDLKCDICNSEIVCTHKTTVDLSAVEPTCTKNGLTAGEKCYICGEIITEQEIIPAFGHNEIIDDAVAPTCTETGLTEGKHCSVCNSVLVEQTVVDATGHAWDHDCDTDCNNCGETRVTAHKDENHDLSCDICGVAIDCTHAQVVQLSAVDPTCTESGLTGGEKCTICNVVLTKQEVIPALGHTEVIDNAVAATCTDTGLTEGKHCSVWKTPSL